MLFGLETCVATFRCRSQAGLVWAQPTCNKFVLSLALEPHTACPCYANTRTLLLSPRFALLSSLLDRDHEL